jgi:hypothetical protein
VVERESSAKPAIRRRYRGPQGRGICFELPTLQRPELISVGYRRCQPLCLPATHSSHRCPTNHPAAATPCLPLLLDNDKANHHNIPRSTLGTVISPSHATPAPIPQFSSPPTWDAPGHAGWWWLHRSGQEDGDRSFSSQPAVLPRLTYYPVSIIHADLPRRRARCPSTNGSSKYGRKTKARRESFNNSSLAAGVSDGGGG